MRFEIVRETKCLIFDSALSGLVVDGEEFLSGKEGILIYDQTKGLQADIVATQMSTNTSTLVPALRILGLSYNSYFSKRTVIESQNDITFYWAPSKLAAYYNRYSTDKLEYGNREQVIRQAVNFITSNTEGLPLEEELLKEILEPCKLLGFYQGFPIFDNSVGFAKLQSRLGIHVGSENIMISTPMDRYESDVYEIAKLLSEKTGLIFSKKKNRVIFQKDPSLAKLLGIKLR